MSTRWGIVTAGKISQDFVNAVTTLPGNTVEFVGIAARDVARAQEFAKKYGVKQVFKTYEDLAKSDIEVVYIGALNPDHYDLAKLFLENGKHVLCEKPLCLNEKQVRSLLDFAKKKKLFLMEAVWSRFLPSYCALEEELKSGKLGEILQVNVNFGIPIAAVDRVKKKELGGSVTLDIGIYTLQFAQFVFKDEPIKVTTSGTLNENGIDDSVTIILDYTRGRRAVLNVHGKVKMDNYAEVYGTNGYVKLLEPFHCSERLQKFDGTVVEMPLHKSPIPYIFQNSAGLAFQAKNVQHCINNGLLESPRMSHADSLLLARLEDTVRKQLGVHFDADDVEF